MAVRIQCPDCSARLTAPDSSAGQEIECPKCGTLLALPAAAPEAGEPAPARRKARSRDDEDETPRKKKRPKPAAKASKTPLLIGTGVVVVLVGVGLAVLLGGKKDKPTAGGGGADGGGGTAGTSAGGAATAPADYKVIAPRARFRFDIPKRDPKDPIGLNPSLRQLFITPDGGKVVTYVQANPQSYVEVWDTRGELKRLFTDTVRAMTRLLSPDGTWFEAYHGPDGERREAVSLDTGKPIPGKQSLGGNQLNPYLAGPDRVISLDSTGGFDSPFYLREFTISTGVGATQGVKVYDTFQVLHANPVNGRELFLLGKKNTDRVRVWDIDAKKVAREITLAPPPPTLKPIDTNLSLAVAADGKLLAVQRSTTGHFSPVEFHDDAGARVAQLPEPVSTWQAAFVPGRPLYVAPIPQLLLPIPNLKSSFTKHDIAAFDVRQQKFVAAFRGHTDEDIRLVVSANGKVMATADKSGAVCVWDLDQVN